MFSSRTKFSDIECRYHVNADLKRNVLFGWYEKAVYLWDVIGVKVVLKI